MADGSVIINIEANDKEFELTLEQAGGKAEKSFGSLGGVATKGLKAMGAAVAAAGTAVAGLAAGAVKVGSEFETALAGTSTMFGDVQVDTAGLTDQILALSNATGLAATDITGSLYNALSAGIPVTEDMTGAMEYMESSAKLAAAGFTDIDTAVTATAKVMNAYGQGLDSVDQIQRVMLQTQNKGITTVGELGASLAQVTPTAAAMGVSFENVGAALATMTAAGTPTAQATTQLNSLIAELGKNGTQAAENLSKATEGTAYAGKSFSELMAAGVPLNEVLDLMGDYAEANGLSLIDMFSSIEAGKSALAMAGENSAAFAENLAAMSTEADVVGDAYGKVTDTLGHKVDVLKQGVSNLGIAVYDDLESPLKDAADMASGWVEDVTSALADGGLVAAVGSLGGVIAEAVTYVTGMAPKMIDAGVQLVSGLVQGLAKAAPSIAESAIGMIDTLCDSLLKTSADLVSLGGEMIVALCDGISANTGSILGVIADGLVRFTTVIINTLPELVKTGASLVTSLVQGLMEAVPRLLEAVPDLFSAFMEAMLSSSTMICEAVAQIVQQIAVQLPGMVQMLVDMLPGMIETYVAALMELLPVIVEAVTSMITALAVALPELVTILVEALPGVLDTIIAALVELAPVLIEAVMTIIMALVEALPDIINQIIVVLPTLIDSVIGALLEMLPLLVDCGVQLLTALIDNMPTIISTIVAALPEIINSIVTALLANLPAIIKAGVQLLTALIKNLPTIISKIVSAAPEIVSSLVKEFGNLVTRMVSAGKNLLLGLGDGISNAVSSVVAKAKAAASKVLNAVKGFFGIASPSKVFRDMIGENLMLGLAEGIENESGAAVKAAEKASKDIADIPFAVTAADALRASVEYEQSRTGAQAVKQQMMSGLMRPASYDMDAGATDGGGMLLGVLQDILAAVREGHIVVLDGDKLVGGIIGRINKSLGVIELQTERGV